MRIDCLSGVGLAVSEQPGGGGHVLLASREEWRQQWKKELGAARGPQRLALLMHRFQKHLGAEWLSRGFVEARSVWSRELLSVGAVSGGAAGAYEVIFRLAGELLQGLRPPPCDKVIQRCLALSLGRQDLAELAIDFVVGHRELRALLLSALCSGATGAGPKASGGGSGLCRYWKKSNNKGGLQLGEHFLGARSTLEKVHVRFRRRGGSSELGLSVGVVGGAKVLMLTTEFCAKGTLADGEKRVMSRIWSLSDTAASALRVHGRFFNAAGISHSSYPAGFVVDLAPAGSSETALETRACNPRLSGRVPPESQGRSDSAAMSPVRSMSNEEQPTIIGRPVKLRL